MNRDYVLNHRLMQQGLAGTQFNAAEEVVRLLLGVQWRVYPGASWAVGQRVSGATDATIHAAFNDGRILRTHLLRPTWHFVTPDNIRWMLELTAPRVPVLNGPRYRSSGLDAGALVRSIQVVEAAIQATTYCTHLELAKALAAAGLPDSGLGLTYAVMDAELEGLICRGPARGRQHAYALLADRAPNSRTLSYEDALAAMTLRFFSGHGPVSLRNYVRWWGLTVAAARRGLEMVKDQLQMAEVDGVTVWFADLPAGKPLAPRLGTCFPSTTSVS